MENKRLFQRVLFSHDAKIIIDDVAYTTQVLDLSLHGFLCTNPTDLRVNKDDSCELKLKLDDQHIITMTATVVHIETNSLGMTCQHIDIDSISELKRLIQLNLADDELLHRDIDELAQ